MFVAILFKQPQFYNLHDFGSKKYFKNKMEVESMKGMDKLFNEFATRRVEEICNDMAKENWYLSIQDELIQTRKDICNTYGEELSKLLDKYDYLSLEMSCKTNDEIYAQAFIDAVNMRSGLTAILTEK